MNFINVYKLGIVDKEMFNVCLFLWYCFSVILFDLVIFLMEKYKSIILNKLSVCNNFLYWDKIIYDVY